MGKTMVMPGSAAAVSASTRPTESIPAVLVAGWERTLHAWDDGSSHDTVLGLAAKHEQLAWLAARYREIARERPSDPIPPARLARLQRAVLATLCLAQRQEAEPQRKPYRGAAILLVASVVATLVGLRLADVKTRDYQRAQQSHAVSQPASQSQPVRKGQVVSNSR